MSLDLNSVQQFVSTAWDTDIKDSMCDFIRIPNQSPQFDPECLTNGLQEKALQVVVDWVSKQDIKGMSYRIITAENRTPVLFLTIDPTDQTCTNTILAYSHLDKQPPMLPWGEGLDPYIPVIREEIDKNGKKVTKLYGRGGSDDGYGVYATLTAIAAVQKQNIPHARIVGLIEMCEESGSFDLPYYLQLLQNDIGEPDLIICLDSNCGDYERLWMTTSLRGLVGGVISVQISTEGVHSGMGSGIIPSTFRILRQILDKLEDPKTGEILIEQLHVNIPQDQLDYAQKTVEILGDDIIKAYPFIEGCKPVSDNILELYLNRAWKPTVSYTGIGDIPSLQAAGNVLRPKTSLLLSIRLPPTCDSEIAKVALKDVLESNPPYNAKVICDFPKSSNGFYAPPFEQWLLNSFHKSSQHIWQKDAAFESGGVSIPFLNIMKDAYPKTQFCVAGLLGPYSNAHSSNEMMMIEYMFGITTSMAQIVADHYIEKCQTKNE